MTHQPPDAGGDDVEMIAAALRADVGDLEVYARVLLSTLGESLPSGSVTVDRDRSLADRLAGRAGAVRAIRVLVGDWDLSLELRRGGIPRASVRRAVRGVVISGREVGVDEWVARLAQVLAEQARESASARAALARLLGQG